MQNMFLSSTMCSVVLHSCKACYAAKILNIYQNLLKHWIVFKMSITYTVQDSKILIGCVVGSIISKNTLDGSKCTLWKKIIQHHWTAGGTPYCLKKW